MTMRCSGSILLSKSVARIALFHFRIAINAITQLPYICFQPVASLQSAILDEGKELPIFLIENKNFQYNLRVSLMRLPTSLHTSFCCSRYTGRYNYPSTGTPRGRPRGVVRDVRRPLSSQSSEELLSVCCCGGVVVDS